MASQVQTLFRDQTDSQLTQGFSPAVHNLPNAQVSPALSYKVFQSLLSYRPIQSGPVHSFGTGSSDRRLLGSWAAGRPPRNLREA